MVNRFTEKSKITLSKALKKYGNPEGIQNIYELEGFLVGALCCPEQVNMDDMMFSIFGPEEDTYPEWDNEGEVRNFFDSLFALQNKNNSLLRCASYKPKLLKDKKDHKKWCKGFIKGFGEEGFEMAEKFEDDEAVKGFLVFVCALAGMELSELDPKHTKEDAEKFSWVMENVTTKMLARSAQYLFLRIQEEENGYCCDGDHHHHHHHCEETILH